LSVCFFFLILFTLHF